MRFLFALLIVASPLGAQPVVHAGDHVRSLQFLPMDRFRGREGIVQASGPDSAVVSFTVGCDDTTHQTIAHSQLSMRIAGDRRTISYAISGAMSAFLLGKVAGHFAAHNGGGRDAAKAARYGAALLIPFSAIQGYQTRTTRWTPVTAQTRRTEHLHFARSDGYLSRMCLRRSRPPLGDQPEDVGKHP